MSTARSVVLKDIDGNDCYPKTIYQNVIGLQNRIGGETTIYYGSDVIPSSDVSSFDDIKQDDIYIPTSRNTDTPLFYRCKSISNSIITWDPYGEESILSNSLYKNILDTATWNDGNVSYVDEILTITLTTRLTGAGFIIDLYRGVDTVIEATIDDELNFSNFSWYIKGSTGGYKTFNSQNIKLNKQSGILIITIPSTVIETIGEKVEILASKQSESPSELGLTLSDIKIFSNYISQYNNIGDLFKNIENRITNDGGLLVNKIYSSDIFGLQNYEDGTTAYENGVLTINFNYTGTHNYTGGGFSVRLYKNFKTIIKAKINSSTNYQNRWYINNHQFSASNGAEAIVRDGYLTLSIPASLVEEYGDVVTLLTTNYQASGSLVLSDIRVFANTEIDFDVSYLGELLKPIGFSTPINKKILFLGDSVTALTGARGWSTQFSNILNASLAVNVAVGNARWCDFSDTVYDGNPTMTSGHTNVMGNQVEKILRGKDETNPHYSYVEEYEDFDIIMLAASSNDSVPTEEIEPFFTNNDEPVDISSVDRTKLAGAFRYCVENLQRVYPNAKIFICTPIQAVDVIRNYEGMNARRNYLKALSSRMSLSCVDTFECGICGIYEKYHDIGRDLYDGLHPKESGAKKISYYNAKAVINKYME